jgi:hypothetical protein
MSFFPPLLPNLVFSPSIHWSFFLTHFVLYGFNSVYGLRTPLSLKLLPHITSPIGPTGAGAGVGAVGARACVCVGLAVNPQHRLKTLLDHRYVIPILYVDHSVPFFM